MTGFAMDLALEYLFSLLFLLDSPTLFDITN